jgi:hypothetical protein
MPGSPSVGYKNVQRPEFLSRPPKHPGDVFSATDIALNNEPVGSEPAHFAEHIVGGNFIAAVVDCHLHALLRHLQRDPSAYASRASSN